MKSSRLGAASKEVIVIVVSKGLGAFPLETLFRGEHQAAKQETRQGKQRTAGPGTGPQKTTTTSIPFDAGWQQELLHDYHNLHVEACRSRKNLSSQSAHKMPKRCATLC